MRPPARFSQESRTRIPAPVLRDLNGGIPRLRVSRVQRGGETAWTSEVRSGADRVVAALVPDSPGRLRHANIASDFFTQASQEVQPAVVEERGGLCFYDRVLDHE